MKTIVKYASEKVGFLFSDPEPSDDEVLTKAIKGQLLGGYTVPLPDDFYRALIARPINKDESPRIRASNHAARTFNEWINTPAGQEWNDRQAVLWNQKTQEARDILERLRGE